MENLLRAVCGSRKLNVDIDIANYFTRSQCSNGTHTHIYISNLVQILACTAHTNNGISINPLKKVTFFLRFVFVTLYLSCCGFPFFGVSISSLLTTSYAVCKLKSFYMAMMLSIENSRVTSKRAHTRTQYIKDKCVELGLFIG